MSRNRYTDPDQNQQFLRLIADKVCVSLQVDRDFIDSIEVYDLPNLIAGRMTVLLRARIYGEQLPPVTRTHTIHIPANWRQHWKRDHEHTWWAGWWVRRHPPRLCAETLTVTWENRAEYPFMRARTNPVPDYMGQAVMVHLPGKGSYVSEYLGVRDDSL